MRHQRPLGYKLIPEMMRASGDLEGMIVGLSGM
jgi:hypothetical protein